MQPLKLRKLRVEALLLVEVSDSFERVRAMWHKLSQIGENVIGEYAPVAPDNLRVASALELGAEAEGLPTSCLARIPRLRLCFRSRY